MDEGITNHPASQPLGTSVWKRKKAAAARGSVASAEGPGGETC